MINFLKKNYVYALMSICFCFLLWRAFRGFCWSDEAFYVSTTDRFFRGDIPLVDEWFRTQLSSLVMLPFYAVYMAFTGSNEGIILYFRILYLILSTVAAVVCFRVFRKEYPDHVSGAAALFLMCYAHLNNATFSYYMLSFIFLSLALLLIYDHPASGKKSRLIIAGIMIALAVLCMPAFAVWAAVALLAVIIYSAVIRIIKYSYRPGSFADPAVLKKIVAYTAIGIAIPAAVFALYLFVRVGIGHLARTLPYALIDNEHTNTFGYYIRKPHRSLIQVFGVLTYISYALIAVSFVFQKILKKGPFCHIVLLADTILFAVMAYVSFGHTGYIQAVFFLFVAPVFFVSEKKNVPLFVLMCASSVTVAVIYCFASSDFLYVMAVGAALSSGAGVCILYDHYIGNIRREDGGRVPAIAFATVLAAVIVFTLGVTFMLRMKNVYRDAPVARLTEPVTSGVAKGLYTTKEHLMMYDDVCGVINDHCMDPDGFTHISGNPDGNVLFSKILPWGYAMSTLDCGYPTTWRATAYDAAQLDVFYGINKNSVPDVIIVLDEQYGSYDASGDVADDHNPNLDEMSDYWKDYIRDNGMSEISVKCGKVYLKPR